MFVSGTVPTDPETGAIKGTTIQEQTRQCFSNIQAILERLIEFEAVERNGAYSLTDFVRDVRRGVFSELSSGRVSIDVYRRELQRSLIAAMGAKINPPAAQIPAGLPPQFAAQFGTARSTSDIRAEIRALDADLRSAQGKAADAVTRAHIEDARDRIAKILDPKD